VKTVLSLPLGEVDQGGVGEIHGPIGIAHHQRGASGVKLARPLARRVNRPSPAIKRPARRWC